MSVAIDAPKLTVTGDVQCSGDVDATGGANFTGKLTIAAAPVLMPCIQFNAGQQPNEVIRIMPNGTVELGEGVTLDAATRAFWDGVEKMGGARFALRTSLPQRAAKALTQAEMIAVYDGMKSEDVLANVEPGDHGNAILEAYGRRVIEAAVERAGVQP
ncbi:hypothetical protein PQR05_29745 [Paraburkholderia sediminicola]|uniref:hypothetical protein n=1 Tax=Paraburkholderia sediminicola TaxID=458836 RepID=UPI0038B8F3A8